MTRSLSPEASSTSKPPRPYACDTATEAGAVRAFWQGLGLPGLIDVHTHFMPPNVTAKVWAYFDSAADTADVPWPVTYRGSELDRLRTLRSFGLRRFSALLYPHKPDMARWLNDWSAAFAARTPDCLHSATFFPEAEATSYVARALEQGARIFKAHLQVGDYDPRDPLLDSSWGMLEEAGVPVVVHCGSGTLPGTYTGPGPFASVLARHPRLTAIVAHLGSPEYTDFLDLAERYPNVYLDTTTIFTEPLEKAAPFPPGELPRLQGLGDRVLLGTDFPIIPYPYLHQLEVLEGLEFGNDWLRAVCHDNAARLLAVP